MLNIFKILQKCQNSDGYFDDLGRQYFIFYPDFFLWLSIHKYLQENRSVGSWDQNAVVAIDFAKKVPIQTFFKQGNEMLHKFQGNLVFGQVIFIDDSVWNSGQLISCLRNELGGSTNHRKRVQKRSGTFQVDYSCLYQ